MTWSSRIYRPYQSKNASEKTPFHEQNMSESPQVHSTGPTGTSKDYHKLNPSIINKTSY